MSHPEHKNQVSYRAHYTPTHRISRLERIWINFKNCVEVAIFMLFSWVLYTAIVHFIILG